MKPNPFKPTAGKTPPQLIGREQILLDFTEGLENGAGAPERLMRITGPRGCGKTVMLNEMGRIARERGWLVIDETASPGLGERLLGQLQDQPVRRAKVQSAKLDSRISVAGVSLSLGEISVGAAQLPTTLRQALTLRLDSLKPGLGVMITVDEIQDGQSEEITAVATAIQHLIREDRDIVFVFAGLPAATSELLNAKVLTFLRRAVAENLGDIPISAVEESYAQVLVENGAEASPDLIARMAQASEGYPYLIQLVGYGVWRSAARRQASAQESDTPGSMQIIEADVADGIAQARARLGQAVCAPVVDGLSEVSLDFLRAMAIDDGPSRVCDLAERLGKDKSYVSSYRARLIEENIIRATGHGLVDFAVPYLREYLRG